MATKEIYILVGAPGSGKSWVAEQLSDKFNYVPHDTYGLKSNGDFVNKIAAEAIKSEKPVLCDTPFSLSQIMNPLVYRNFKVVPVFIIESELVTKQRYETRNKPGTQKIIPKGHLTRIGTFLQRAKDLRSFHGTSDEVLEHLKRI